MRRIPLLVPLTLAVLAFTTPILAGCGSDPWVVPVPPPPVPVPPQPIPPTPPPQPTAVATFASTELVKVGMTRLAAEAALAVQPSSSSRQDDGTFLADYPALDEAGKPVWLSVHYSPASVVVGRSRVPRAVPPEPTASLPDGEIECVDGCCRLVRAR